MERLEPYAHLADMPLHAVTELYGPEGLAQKFSYEVNTRFDEEDQQLINQAFIVGNVLHANDARVREPYVNHLLRVSTRLMVHYGVDDPDVVAGGLLHDSVEDHAPEILGLPPQKATAEMKAQALEVLATWFNPRVARFVAGVTNPEFTPGNKREEYLEHLRDLVAKGDPWCVVLKLSDFTDNATGLIYTTGPKMAKLAPKYLPAVPILKLGLFRLDLPLSQTAVAHIESQLDLAEQRLKGIISSSRVAS